MAFGVFVNGQHLIGVHCTLKHLCRLDSGDLRMLAFRGRSHKASSSLRRLATKREGAPGADLMAVIDQ